VAVGAAAAAAAAAAVAVAVAVAVAAAVAAAAVVVVVVVVLGGRGGAGGGGGGRDSKYSCNYVHSFPLPSSITFKYTKFTVFLVSYSDSSGLVYVGPFSSKASTICCPQQSRNDVFQQYSQCSGLFGGTASCGSDK
jgi:hypothetical protein